MKTFSLTLLATSVVALDNGLGKVPQMGWNTWNKFACDIDEDLIKQTIDSLVDLGLDKIGYNYVNLDDCWMLPERTDDGHFIPDPQAFPKGMKDLGDFIHDRNLKFGIYSCAGTMTCAGRAGSLYHEEIDAMDFASWGVDYLKYDNCYNNSVPGITRYPAMRDALAATGRPIFYSGCNWGEEESWRWGPDVFNSWRTTQDIWDDWSSVEYNFLESQRHFERSGPGAWNDPDMLEVGNGGLTIEEEKSHFAMWALAKAPLIIGCDITAARQESLDILMNEDLIAVNQDPNSTQATCMIGCSEWDRFWRVPSVYATKVTGGDVVAMILNWRERVHDEFKFKVQDLGVIPGANQYVQVYDLWKHEMIGEYTLGEMEYFEVKNIPGHGNFTFKFTIVDMKTDEEIQEEIRQAVEAEQLLQ